MDIGKLYLFIEVEVNKIIFCVVKYSEELNLEIKEKKILDLKDIENRKIANLKKSSNLIREEMRVLEKKLNTVFKKVIVAYHPESLQIINISGYKKINGQQILHDDISYILNDIKKIVMNGHADYSLLHLFNSNYVLDKNPLNNLPIGLYGEFYNQHLTFFLMRNSEIQNIKIIFSESQLEIEKIILKPFALGIKKVNEEKDFQDPLVILNIFNNRTSVSIFIKSSLIYCKEYNFGSDIIKKDISKVCSLKIETVHNILKEIEIDKIEKNTNNILDSKFFNGEIFRKISINHLREIIEARLNEISDIILNKNVDVSFLKNKKKKFFVRIEDFDCMKNFKEIIIGEFVKNNSYEIDEMTQDDHFESCISSAEILSKGWEKEAIPIIHQKKSLISKIFSTLFK